MKGLGALQRHQLPHPPCKNPGSATGSAHGLGRVGFNDTVMGWVHRMLEIRTACKKFNQNYYILK